MKPITLILGLIAGAAAASAIAQPAPPVILGEWAGDCSGDFRLGYRLGTEGELVAYMVNKGVASDFGKPVLSQIDAEFFSLDFKDGAPPIVWRREADTIRPWSQGEGDAAPIKNGIRDGQATPAFRRCR